MVVSGCRNRVGLLISYNVGVVLPHLIQIGAFSFLALRAPKVFPSPKLPPSSDSK